MKQHLPTEQTMSAKPLSKYFINVMFLMDRAKISDQPARFKHPLNENNKLCHTPMRQCIKKKQSMGATSTEVYEIPTFPSDLTLATVLLMSCMVTRDPWVSKHIWGRRCTRKAPPKLGDGVWWRWRSSWADGLLPASTQAAMKVIQTTGQASTLQRGLLGGDCPGNAERSSQCRHPLCVSVCVCACVCVVCMN